MNDIARLTLPEEIFRTGVFSVTIDDTALLGSPHHFLRIDAYPLRDPDGENRHFGFWDLPLTLFTAPETKVAIDGTELFIPAHSNGWRQPFSWQGPLQDESGDAVWHLLIYRTAGGEHTLVSASHTTLAWDRKRSPRDLLLSPGSLPRLALRYGLQHVEELKDLAVAELRKGNTLPALNLLFNIARLQPGVFSKGKERDGQLCLNVLHCPADDREESGIFLRIFQDLLSDKHRERLAGHKKFLSEHLHAETEIVKTSVARYLFNECALLEGNEDEIITLLMENNERCLEPYGHMAIVPYKYDDFPERAFMPCCYYARQTLLSLKSEFYIDKIWNDYTFCASRIDTNINNSSFEEEHCAFCIKNNTYKLVYKTLNTLSEKLSSTNLSTKYKNNILKAREHILQNDIIVSSYPLAYFISLDSRCNIRCTMCSVKHTKYSEVYSLSPQNVDSILPYFDYAQCVTFSGGEPLMSEHAQKISEYIVASDSLNNQITVSIGTNGTLLDKAVNWLLPLNNFLLLVSTDSLGQTYEQIRVGAKWTQVEKNILQYREITETKNGSWSLHTCNLLMKSTLPALPDFATWHCKHHIGARFNPVFSHSEDPATRAEDLLRFPELLAEVPAWRELLEESIAIFAAHGRTAEATEIQTYFDDLQRRVRGKDLEGKV